MNDKTQKVSENRQKKEAIVAEVSEKVNKAKAMVFTNFEGLTHKQLEEFKREIKKSDAEFAATKNTLLKLSLGTDAIAGNEDKFQKPTGTIFMYGDVVAPLKVLAKMVKEIEKPQIKFGLLEGKPMTDKEVLKLSTLPNRETLIAQMLGMMNAPIQGLHRAVSWNLQKFVMTLAAIEKQKATMPAAAPKVAEPKVETAAPATPVAETPVEAASEPAAEQSEAAAVSEEPTATETEETEEKTAE